MRRALIMPLLAAGCLGFAGCSPTNARVGVSPPPGLIYSHIKAPMGGPRLGERAPIQLPDDHKTGTATFRSIDLNVPTQNWSEPLSVGWGDGSWDKALRNGGIEEAYFADYRELKILNGIYTEIEIIVYGR